MESESLRSTMEINSSKEMKMEQSKMASHDEISTLHWILSYSSSLMTQRLNLETDQKRREVKMRSSLRAIYVLILGISLIIASLTTMGEAGSPSPPSSSENVADLRNKEKIPEKQVESSLHKIPPTRWNPIQN